MGEGEWRSPPLTVTAPPFAGPDDPAIEMGLAGDDIPEILRDYYAALGVTIEAIIQLRLNADQWDYVGVATAGPGDVELVAGTVDEDAVTVMEGLAIVYDSLAQTIFLGDLGGLTEFIILTVNSFVEISNRLIVDELLFVEDGIYCEPMRHGSDAGGSGSETTTTYSELSTPCGETFIAPQSGCVSLVYSAILSNNTATGGAACAPRVGTGGTIGGGTQVLAAADVNAATFNGTPSSSFNVKASSSVRVIGLTPGDTYNASMRLRRLSSGGTAAAAQVSLLIIPEL